MSLMRKAQAKYGAKIPVARSTGAKRVLPSPPATSAGAAPKARRDAMKNDDKKR